jgi:hypothetical protein
MADHEHDGMKKCTKCGEWKPATAEYFCRDKTRKDGLNPWCKVCKSDQGSEYYQKNKDRAIEYYQKNKERVREYRQKNRDRRRECGREYEQTPVGRLVKSIYHLRRKTGAAIYVRDMTDEEKETLANQYVAVRTLEKTEKELLAASGKKRCSVCGDVFDFDMFCKAGGRHRAECKACEAKYQHKYRQQNKDKIKEHDRKYRQQNKDKIKEREREYREKNKEKIKEYQRKYRQNKKQQKST